MNKTNPQMEYEKAIAYILDKIKSGELSIGSKLPAERVIADTLHIGRNSTREALSILHGMGMVDRVHGSGNYISEHVNDTIYQMLVLMLALGSITKREICEFRRTMEKAACMLILEKGLRTDYQEQFEQLLLDLKVAAGQKQTDLDKAFHMLLIQATENALLEMMMHAVITVYREWIDVVLQKAGNAEKLILQKCHEGIINGLIAKKADDLLASIDVHYDLIERLLA